MIVNSRSCWKMQDSARRVGAVAIELDYFSGDSIIKDIKQRIDKSYNITKY